AAPRAADNCDPSPSLGLAEVRANGPCPDTFALTRTWTATDACGNRSSRSQVVSVRDTSAPSLVGVPPGVTVECDAVPAPATPGARDNCDPSPRVALSESRAPGRCPNEYTLTRTWTATDRCSNAASASQVLLVVDTTPPALFPPDDKTVECPPPSSGLD